MESLLYLKKCFNRNDLRWRAKYDHKLRHIIEILCKPAQNYKFLYKCMLFM